MLTLLSDIRDLKHMGPATAEKMSKLGIHSLYDLLYFTPNRYIDYSKNIKISHTQIGEIVTVKGEVRFIRNQYSKTGKKIQLAEIKDETSSLLLVWFNQPYLNKILFPGDIIYASGKVSWFGKNKAMVTPVFEKTEKGQLHTGKIIPVYHETKGITSKFIRSRLNDVVSEIENLVKDPLPTYVKEKYNLIGLIESLVNIHFPTSEEDYLSGIKRLAFDEMLSLHIKSYYRKESWKQNSLREKLENVENDLHEFTNSLPFELTSSQIQVINEIAADMQKEKPMNRLLEGDVGSGKTVVAAAAIYIAYKNKCRSIIMAPTQILAEQHFQTLSKLFEKRGIKVGILTGKSKTTLDTDVIVGTHALIHHKDSFKDVGLVIIDEQHKFGVNQRKLLVVKSTKGNTAPHLLSMTATPIPRTIALTLYGDQDLSVIDELPKNRILPKTWIVNKDKEISSYDWVKKEIRDHNTSVFVVCPLIGDDDLSEEDLESEEIANVKTEYKYLKEYFKEFNLGLLHGKQKIEEKNETLKRFKNGEYNLLVATSVIEVGVDIPSANIIMIKGADRFGLAQLHQLRGRVGRGGDNCYCLLYSDSKSESVMERLNILKEETSGFKLSEKDLELRGPGQLFGFRQHGYPELKIAQWNDLPLIHQTQEALHLMIEESEDLTKFKESNDEIPNSY